MQNKYTVDSGEKECNLYLDIELSLIFNETEYNELEDSNNKTSLVKETMKFYKPGWSLLNHIDAACVQPLFGVPNEALKSKLLLTYLLKHLSFFELSLSTDNDEYEYLENLNELIGDKGIKPFILDKIDNEIRMTCYK